MTDVRLRLATLADFEHLHRLYKDLVGTIAVPDGDVGRAQMAKILDHPGTTVFVADLQGLPVSMATLHVLPNMTFGGRSYALVENVVTLRAHHGLGLGRQVMEHVAQAAWDAGAYKIMLLTGKDLGARGFYEKLGFTAEEKFGMTLRRAPKRQPV